LADYTIFSVFLATILFLLLTIVFILSFITINSFAFYLLGSIESFLNAYEWTSFTMRTYPGNFLKNNKIKFVFMSIPVFFIGTLIVPIFQGKFVEDIISQLSIILFIFIFCSTITWINWHYGLKKYEAFG